MTWLKLLQTKLKYFLRKKKRSYFSLSDIQSFIPASPFKEYERIISYSRIMFF